MTLSVRQIISNFGNSFSWSFDSAQFFQKLTANFEYGLNMYIRGWNRFFMRFGTKVYFGFVNLAQSPVQAKLAAIQKL